MKNIITIAFFLCLTGMAAAQKKKTVFVIVDGVSRDVLKSLPTPNMHAIAKEGGLLDAYQGGERDTYSQTPTISAPGYYNVLTGVWFNKHNVPDNDIKAPNYHYPTIFRLFEDQYPEKQTAVFSSWEDNRTKLIGEGLPATRNIKIDYHFDGLELDTVKYPHDRGRIFMSQIDQAVTDEAARTIRSKGPDLSWVYLEFPDDMGHMYGDSRWYNDAVQLADRQVGQLWDAIKYRKRKFNEDWLIVITTDHGRDPKTGHGHGGQSDRERASWIVTNAKELNSYAKQTKELSVVDILPTISRFMDVRLSGEQQRELDGIPLIGKVSIAQPSAVKVGEKISVTWKAIADEGKVKIWLASTNDYKQTGKADNYKLVGETHVKDGKFDIDLRGETSSDFYKVVMEGDHNTLNRWIINKK